MTAAQTSLLLIRFRNCSGMVATGGLVLCLLEFLLNRGQFFHSYLLGFLFCVGIPLGAFAVLMIHHLTGGHWGHLIRPVLTSASRTLPLFVPLFVPIFLGIHDLYLWTNPRFMAQDVHMQRKAEYLNTTFFTFRTVLYFGIWVGLAMLVQRMKSPLEATHDERRRSRSLCAPGLVIYGLTATAASIDWIMSLEPQWHSTIYGMSYAVGQVLSGLAFAIVVLVMPLAGKLPLDKNIRSLNDLGNLLLTFVMLWAYLAFSQYLIIWSGSLPSEIEWYAKRTSGAWLPVAWILIVFHFAVPFLLLLSREVKRSATALGAVAFAVLMFRLVDLFWIAAPAFQREGFAIHWMDIVAPLTLGAIWLAAFTHFYGKSANFEQRAGELT